MSNFVELSDRDWLLKRPHNIIGAVQEMKQEGFLLEGDKFVWKEYYIVPGFLKIINEIIDNSVDTFIKSDGKYGTKIEVTITNDKVKVKDNGTGIPVEKRGGQYIPLLAWGRPRAGTNFNDEENVGSMGMNGIGSYATAVFSKKFIGKTCDGKKSVTVKFTNNLETAECSKPISCFKNGTEVEFWPDLERFGLEKIEDIYKTLIRQRLMHIGYSYPEIQFKFNGEVIKNDNVSYFSKFSKDLTLFNGKNFSVAFAPNDTGEFKFFSYIDGLYTSKGGKQIDFFIDKVLPSVREKLLRKHKNIKITDIKNELTLIVIFRNFKAPKFSGQNKEEFTSSFTDIQNFLKENGADISNWGERIYKNKAIIEPIISKYKFKEAYKEKQELEKLKKTKKIKTDKYYRPTKKADYCFICEGHSALSGLLPSFGRENIGYYELKGKPLNAYSSSVQKFKANTELNNLYQILKNEITIEEYPESEVWYEIAHKGKKYIANKNDEVFIDEKWVSVDSINVKSISKPKSGYTEQLLVRRKLRSYSGYKKIVFATDQDLDGFNIRGLLIGFFVKYFPELVKHEKIAMLQTPIMAEMKNGKPVKWVYDINDADKLSGEIKYFKGLGSHKKENLRKIKETDGLEKMIEPLVLDENALDMIDSWLNSNRSDDRKEMIRNNSFDLIKL